MGNFGSRVVHFGEKGWKFCGKKHVYRTMLQLWENLPFCSQAFAIVDVGSCGVRLLFLWMFLVRGLATLTRPLADDAPMFFFDICVQQTSIMYVQDEPLQVINGVPTPINGVIYG